MKNSILFLVLFFVTAKMFAQENTTSKGTELSIGVDAGLPMGDLKETNKFGIGGTAKFAYNIDESIALTLQSGYMTFTGESYNILGVSGKYSALNIIPIKVGGRYTFAGGPYLEPQLGLSLLSSKGGNGTTGFTYAINAGYRMTPGVDISARYEGISKEGTISFIGLRLAYSFAIGAK